MCNAKSYGIKHQMVCKRAMSSQTYGIIDFNQCMGGVDRVYQCVGKCICRIGCCSRHANERHRRGYAALGKCITPDIRVDCREHLIELTKTLTRKQDVHVMAKNSANARSKCIVDVHDRCVILFYSGAKSVRPESTVIIQVTVCK